MAQRQVNIRLAEEDVAVLEAAAFLDELAVSDLVRTILLERVTALRGDAAVGEALRLRAERAAIRSGVVSSLADRRSRGRGDAGSDA